MDNKNKRGHTGDSRDKAGLMLDDVNNQDNKAIEVCPGPGSLRQTILVTPRPSLENVVNKYKPGRLRGARDSRSWLELP